MILRSSSPTRTEIDVRRPRGQDLLREGARVGDVRAQRDRAAGQGGTILMEPTDLPFGEQQYTVLYPWGHHLDVLADDR